MTSMAKSRLCLLRIRGISAMLEALAAFTATAHHLLKFLLLVGGEDRATMAHRVLVNLFHLGTTVLLRLVSTLASILHLLHLFFQNRLDLGHLFVGQIQRYLHVVVHGLGCHHHSATVSF